MPVKMITNIKFYTPASKDYGFLASNSTNKGNYLNYLRRKHIEEELSKTTLDNKTRKILQQELEKLDQAKEGSLVGYMYNREGSLGEIPNNEFELFNAVGNNISNDSLPEVHPKSNIWTIVVSFDEESTINYDLPNMKRLIANNSFKAICSHNNLNPRNFTYQAAFHTNTSKHHLHFRVYQPSFVKDEDIRVRGKLKKDTYIAVSRQNVMLFENNKSLFVEMNKEKIELKTLFKDVIRNNREIGRQLDHLSKDIKKTKGTKGRLQYNNIHSEKLLFGIDQLVEKIIDSNQNLKDKFTSFNDKLNDTYSNYENRLKQNWNTSTSTYSDLNKKLASEKNNIQNELKGHLGNAVLKTIKENDKNKNLKMSYHQKNYYKNNKVYDRLNFNRIIKTNQLFETSLARGLSRMMTMELWWEKNIEEKEMER